MKSEWDQEKAVSNLVKHDVEFADAVLVFSDLFALFEKDLSTKASSVGKFWALPTPRYWLSSMSYATVME